MIIILYDNMMIEKSISVTEAARSFSEVVNRAHYRGERFLLVKNNRPFARIVPAGVSGATARELADFWPRVPHLSPEEATSLEDDIQGARVELPEAVDPGE